MDSPAGIGKAMKVFPARSLEIHWVRHRGSSGAAHSAFINISLGKNTTNRHLTNRDHEFVYFLDETDEKNKKISHFHEDT